jgi:Uma2 family endonuclease
MMVVSQEMVTDTWVRASWEEFLALADDPAYEKGKFYYDQGRDSERGWMRVEMSPIGAAHGRDNSVVARVVSLFATFKTIRVVEYTNASFKKAEVRECQPDSSFYIGDRFRLPPRTNSPVDVDQYDPPTLVIEVAATTLDDDLGRKRLIYERLGVREYWVVDVTDGEMIAFEVFDGGSRQIRESQVLPGLAMNLIEEALERSQTEDDGAVNRWLLQTFGAMEDGQ